MARGKFSVTHKGSDGGEIDSVNKVSEDDAVNFVEDNIDELEGDSGASLTVTWED